MEISHIVGDGKQSRVSLDPQSGDLLASLAQVPIFASQPIRYDSSCLFEKPRAHAHRLKIPNV